MGYGICAGFALLKIFFPIKTASCFPGKKKPDEGAGVIASLRGFAAKDGLQ